MGKAVYIAEKPSVAQEFAKALKLNAKRKDGYLESEEAIVTWCVGHLVTMSYPEVYDPALKKWSLNTLPFLPQEFQYEVIPGVAKQFQIVSSLLNRQDVDTIYVCTDSGREGEYIYRLVEQEAHVTGKQRKRVWIDSQTEEEILRSCRTAFSGGWSSVKLYFMLGLPTETDEDVLGIAELAEKVYKAWKECTPNPKRGVTITVSTACFVPKPHTAFQWEAQVSMEEYRRRGKLLRDNMRGRSIRYNWHDPDTSFLEAVFSRGDRRVADVIEEAWRQGAKFDAWSEYFDFDRWMAAFDACGLDPAFYANRVREKDEVLPWSVTSTGVTTPFLWRERERAYQAVITPDCRVQCTGCGADKLYPGGKCDAEA